MVRIICGSIFLFFCVSKLLSQQQKWLVDGQDSAFPVYTNVDTNVLKKYGQKYDVEQVIYLQKYLQPFINKNDAFATFLYAETFGAYFPSQKNTKELSTLILNFYKYAADMNIAKANFTLHEIYRYGYLQQKIDAKASLKYLRRCIIYGNNIIKSRGYEELGKIFHPKDDTPEFSVAIKKNEDSSIYYLQKSIEYDIGNTSTIQALGMLYLHKEDFKKAFEVFSLSQHPEDILYIAKWLIEGEHIPKDINKGLSLIYPLAKKEKEHYDNIHDDYEYTNCEAILLLNHYYENNIISKEQLSPFSFEEIRNQHPPATMGVFMDWLAPGQDSAFPVRTMVDSNELKKYANIMDFGCEFIHVNNYRKIDSFLTFRDFLQPYIDKEDPYALYLYGRTFPLNHFIWSNTDIQDKIYRYYFEASQKNLAMAEFAIPQLLAYTILGNLDDTSIQIKRFDFLQKSLQHGDNFVKSLACYEIVDFFSSDFLPPYFEENDDSCIHYLQMAIKYNPKNNHAIQYLGYLYEKNKMYQQAFDIYLMSNDQDDILKMAYWLIEGKKIKKDLKKALSIIYPYAKEAKEKYSKDHYDNYLHNINPVYLLNNLYAAKKISKPQIGNFLIPNYKPKKIRLD